MGDAPSSPAPAAFQTTEEELAYYKSQYEHLELELQDFQASSRELETELEKDIEASEKRERHLQEKLENLAFEVEEWKAKYKQAKNEAGNAQSILQKEITSLRDSNRTLQLKLRDIEVANDDYERQARNTTSSLEDLESKYNVSIERGVLLEEEIKVGEQEREGLRIDNQRLRDELSDLKIEAEIIQEKLRLAETTIAQGRQVSAGSRAFDHVRSQSPTSSSSATTVSSPTMSTPPASTSDPSAFSETPPSPPVSESAVKSKSTIPVTPAATKSRMRSTTTSAAIPRKPGLPATRTPSHIRGPSIVSTTTSATPSFRRSVTQRPAASATPVPRSRPSTQALKASTTAPLPRSGSLHHIRALRGKMEKLEARVHSARSKLPAPTATPPRASPRGMAASHLSHTATPSITHIIPATVTVRSSKKRTSTATSSSVGTRDSDVGSGIHGRRSLGGARTPLGTERDRTSLLGGFPDAYAAGSRPSSRASVASASAGGFVRPSSRASMTNIRAGARTPVGGFASGASGVGGAATIRRPRSSVSGTYSNASFTSSVSGSGPPAGHGHGHSHSVSHFGRSVNGAGMGPEDEDEDEDASFVTPVARRSTMDRALAAGSGIPTPAALRRQSRGGGEAPRRQSGMEGEMGPPERRGRLSEVGETY